MRVSGYVKMVAVTMLAVTAVYGQEKKVESGKKAKPLKVYLLAGQSNATGIVKNSTLEHIKIFPDTAAGVLRSRRLANASKARR